jgi:RimJ/RimL family protein N-acetyltransferase
VDDKGAPAVELRSLDESDLDTLFRHMSDPESVRMAAFTPEDPDDRQRFDAHMARVLASPDSTNRAIVWNGELVGSIASFVIEGQTEVRTRPRLARAASDNVSSLRVLEKNGFQIIGTEMAFAPARGAEIEETILQLG